MDGFIQTNHVNLAVNQKARLETRPVRCKNDHVEYGNMFENNGKRMGALKKMKRYQQKKKNKNKNKNKRNSVTMSLKRSIK